MNHRTICAFLLISSFIFQSCDSNELRRRREKKKEASGREGRKAGKGIPAQALADSLLHKELIQIVKLGDAGFGLMGDTTYNDQNNITNIVTELTIGDLSVSYNASFQGRDYSNKRARAELQVGRVTYKRIPSVDGKHYDSLYYFLPDMKKAAVVSYTGRKFFTVPATYISCNGPFCYIRKVMIFEIRDGQPQSYKVLETDLSMSGLEFGDYDRNEKLDFLILGRNERPGTFESDLRDYEMYPRTFDGADWITVQGLTRYLALKKSDDGDFCVTGGYWPSPLPKVASCGYEGEK